MDSVVLGAGAPVADAPVGAPDGPFALTLGLLAVRRGRAAAILSIGLGLGACDDPSTPSYTTGSTTLGTTGDAPGDGSGSTGAEPDCGDGTINQEEEVCDGSDLGGQTCEGLGFGPGTLTCSEECTLIDDGCDRCGNGRIDAGEYCDGSIGNATCEDFDFPLGEVRCADDCSEADISGCYFPECGDGMVNQEDEECDGGDLGGSACEDVGFGGGTLACTAECGYETSGCCLGFFGRCQLDAQCCSGNCEDDGECGF